MLWFTLAIVFCIDSSLQNVVQTSATQNANAIMTAKASTNTAARIKMGVGG
jgi:hypothetical protein